MSQEAVAEILGRVLRDRGFAARLRSEPDAALAGYELTEAERAAIVEGIREEPGSAPLQDRPRRASRLV